MSVAKSYARALLEATNQTEIEGVQKDLEQFVSVLQGSSALRRALFAPVLSAREKGVVLEQLAKSLSFGPALSRFLALLARRGRLSLVVKIRDAFDEVKLQAEGGMFGRLVAADAVGERDVESLAGAFAKKLGKKISFRVSEDASLLAGMKVSVGGVTYDGTLKTQLQKLRDRLVIGSSGVSN